MKHRPLSCDECETTETVYEVKLSVIITLAGAPTCHTRQSIFENAMSWMETLQEQGVGAEVIDHVKVVDVRKEQ